MVVVGAGIAGACIAIVLARRGLEVLLLERQREYRDRVRGEYMAPWGVLEARANGVEGLIRSTGAVDARYGLPYDERREPSAAEKARFDTGADPEIPSPLCASHPKTCEALVEGAVSLGAELIRGVGRVRLQAGKRPSISFRDREVKPRLIIGADGRTSSVRGQIGATLQKAPPTHVMSGLLVTGETHWPGDQYSIGVDGDLQFYVFPQGVDRLRLYTCHGSDQASRWVGPDGATRFIEAFGQLKAIPSRLGLGEVKPAGPCATFACEQTWCDTPYADGVVLVGDAAGYDDPVDGQGLSLAMRDVRLLSETISTSEDWSPAALRPYGEQRAEGLRRMRRVSTTYAAIMTTFSAEGRARRGRIQAARREGSEDVAMALDAITLGPDRLPAEAFTDELHESILN